MALAFRDHTTVRDQWGHCEGERLPPEDLARLGRQNKALRGEEGEGN